MKENLWKIVVMVGLIVCLVSVWLPTETLRWLGATGGVVIIVSPWWLPKAWRVISSNHWSLTATVWAVWALVVLWLLSKGILWGALALIIVGTPTMLFVVLRISSAEKAKDEQPDGRRQ